MRADLSSAKISRILFLWLTFKVTYTSFDNASFALGNSNLCANASFANISKITKHIFQMQNNHFQDANRIPQVWQEWGDFRDRAYGDPHLRYESDTPASSTLLCTCLSFRLSNLNFKLANADLAFRWNLKNTIQRPIF